MARLIEATRIEQYILNNCSDNEEINAIYAEIVNAPTVDAVEVVRCKDCKHSDKIIFPKMPEMLICWSDEQSDRMVCANGYCDMGERREECAKRG